MKIHYLQHVSFEGLGLIKNWAEERNHSLSSTHFYADDYALPSLDDFDCLVVMGGPMSANDGDQYTWLAEEKALIKAAIECNKYVLGICLGAQLIANVLGAKVIENEQKEIGWFPISFNDQLLGSNLLSGIENNLTVLHWHGERFDIPVGARRLASSYACENQGFIYKQHVLGLQFHLEMNDESVENIVEACGEECASELVSGEFIQSRDEILKKTQQYAQKSVLYRLLDNLIET